MPQLLTAGPRKIKSGNEYDYLFSAPSFSDPIVTKNGTFDKTLETMAKIAESDAGKIVKLAMMLSGPSTEKTCQNIHRFMNDHIQYAIDDPTTEQIRSVNRTWNDRKTGVDCDCMSVFESAILRALNIPHRFRIASYSPDGDYEHVYVVVPKNGKSLAGGQIILDGVIHQFDNEKTYTKAQDYNMDGQKIQILNGIPIQVLNGISSLGSANFTYNQHEVAEHNRKLKHFLAAQLSSIQQNPDQLRHIHPQQAIENLNYVLKNWDNEHNRASAVELLAQKEQQHHPEITFFRAIRSFFEGKITCSNVCASGYVQLTPETIAQIQGTIALAGLHGDDFIAMRDLEHKANKFFPVMAAGRGAFLALLRLNAFGWAERMAPAFFPVNNAGESTESSWFYGKGNLENKLGTVKNINYNQQFTRIFGLTPQAHLNSRKKMFDYVLRRWYNLGGDWDAFKNATLKGAHNMLVKVRPLSGYQYWCRYDDYNLKPNGTAGPTQSTPTWRELELNGVAGLGDGGATAAILTAATPIIVALAGLISLFAKPTGTTIDANTGLTIPTTPTSNPDPANHPNAALSASTGMWTDAKTGEVYNPVSKTWEKPSSGSSITKYVLIAMGVLGIGYGIYSIIPDDKPKPKSK